MREPPAARTGRMGYNPKGSGLVIADLCPILDHIITYSCMLAFVAIATLFLSFAALCNMSSTTSQYAKHISGQIRFTPVLQLFPLSHHLNPANTFL